MGVTTDISHLSLYLVFGCLSLIPGALGQYDCDRYCFASCSEYHGDSGSEFADCVDANVYCSCMTKLSFRNPFLYFVLFAGSIFLCIVCGICYRAANRGGRYTSHAIVAQPITGNMPHNIVAQPVTSYTNINQPHICPNSRIGTGEYPPYQGSQASPFVIPTEQQGSQHQHPQSKDELPSEYLPPPEYNTCVPNVNEVGSPYNHNI